jgi:hypothetical protein
MILLAMNDLLFVYEYIPTGHGEQYSTTTTNFPDMHPSKCYTTTDWLPKANPPDHLDCIMYNF